MHFSPIVKPAWTYIVFELLRSLGQIKDDVFTSNEALAVSVGVRFLKDRKFPAHEVIVSVHHDTKQVTKLAVFNNNLNSSFAAHLSLFTLANF